MATQRVIPRRVVLTLCVPIGDGNREVVNLPTDAVDSALLAANDQSPVEAASYQRIADQLLAADCWSPRRVFVSSPTAGDGKTSTAFNLAWTLSTRGASVLLVELNFARPRFSSVLGGLPIRFGVDCVIRRTANPADSVFSMGSESLNVSAVKTAMRLGELKQHLPHLASYLNWAGKTFDWLILDCPPVLSVAWNSWFRACARPVLLVVREQHTPAVQVRKAIRNLGGGLKGVLLNDAGT